MVGPVVAFFELYQWLVIKNFSFFQYDFSLKGKHCMWRGFDDITMQSARSIPS